MPPILPTDSPLGAHLEGIPVPHADILLVADMLCDDERAKLQEIHEFLQTEIRPVVGEYWDREEFPFDLLPLLAEHGLGEIELSDTSRLFRGLVYAEVTRADVSFSTLVGIHNELVIGVINGMGSDAQREKWLPGLRRFEKVGCFALTEPDHGSDVAGGLATSAQRTDDGWVINGKKRWIGGGTFADFTIVFARDTEDHTVKAFLVENDREGVRTSKISGKLALRIMQNADMTFDNVEIPAENIIEGVKSFADLNTYLCTSRAWVAWQGAGLQLGIFDKAREYALKREQFGRPLAKFQLVQESLARILGNASASLGMMAHIAQLQERGLLDMPKAAMAKATTTRLARESAAVGRALAGGNGILTEYDLSKMMADAEALYTYEGTYDINSLIVGRAVTGHSAFV
ncbi:acyl-CoA dehydrogenase family protein [Corynebacterium aquatimens]|uniref:Glutaryl-CoA dehydrogenase n=1 Tax=Corynebacterium aquatimens TaxID=1190508 RepID=A0A931DZW6_9CORY|nr:acyl-CoA dehydrogenase family protein [Corynebacterium aquatimens]MBG6121176.1 glutaryl-CoA dehydrogenase [Corynebacterium aquatimens]WJY66270.1 Acyl-CoA dehydrogenase [Corynebacterium aquatimens]